MEATPAKRSPETERIEPAHYEGLGVSVGLVVAGVMVWRLVGDPAGTVVFGGFATASLGFLLAYFVRPDWRWRLMWLVRQATFPVRWTATLLTMLVLFYGVVTPVAIWFRWAGKSIRRSDPQATSFWREVHADESDDSFFRMF
ncbi:hypothetical protein C2E31_27305 [Rhodopirellula baltica]|nr:hypothetical protein C2E31_27305 [Rhodopirellula baltica]